MNAIERARAEGRAAGKAAWHASLEAHIEAARLRGHRDPVNAGVLQQRIDDARRAQDERAERIWSKRLGRG